MDVKRIIKEEINLLEVSDKLYELLKTNYSESRLVMTQNENIEFTDKTHKQKLGPKPIGLWYGIGTEWIDWTRSDMPEWEYDNVFEVIINESNVLLINTLDEIKEFNDTYGVEDKRFANIFSDNSYHDIDWSKIAEKYSGVEISPYMWPMRNELRWYYGWDVASGCIWNSNGIKSIKKITI
jgi:hypothetical protein